MHVATIANVWHTVDEYILKCLTCFCKTEENYTRDNSFYSLKPSQV